MESVPMEAGSGEMVGDPSRRGEQRVIAPLGREQLDAERQPSGPEARGDRDRRRLECGPGPAQHRVSGALAGRWSFAEGCRRDPRVEAGERAREVGLRDRDVPQRCEVLRARNGAALIAQGTKLRTELAWI